MELLDLYDINGNLTGKTVVRGTSFTNGYIKLAVIIIQNKNGDYLLEKSSFEKGGYYSFIGGHVKHSEDSLTAILRETNEEVELLLEKDELQFVGQFKHFNRPCLIDLYKLKKDLDLKTLVIQPEEVEKILLVSSTFLDELIASEQFLPFHARVYIEYKNSDR